MAGNGMGGRKAARLDGCAERRAARAGNVLARIAGGLFLALSALLVALVALFYDDADFNFGTGIPTSALPAAVGMLAATFLAAALAILAALASRRARHRCGRATVVALAFASLAVFAVQALLIRNVYGYPGWDAGTLLDRALCLATGQDPASFYGDGLASMKGYYGHYPNNALLTCILAAVMRIALALGVDSVFLCDLAGAASVCLGGLLAALAVRRIVSNAGVMWAGFALYTVLFSWSPWISVPYSDTYVTGFVALLLYLSVGLFVDRNRPEASPARQALASLPRWASLALVAALGYLVKPTAAIVFVAIVLAWAVSSLGKPPMRFAAQAGALVAGLALAGVFAFGVAAPLAYRTLGIDASSGMALGMSHFLMMGQNDETTGAYLQQDVDFSTSIANPDDRKAANLEVALDRIGRRGLLGNAAFFAKKLTFSFGDGAFSWAVDGADDFLMETYPEPGPAAHALRGLFYRTAWQADADQVPFRTYTQVAWYTVLALWVPAGLALTLRGSRRAAESGGARLPWSALVPATALVGMALYLVLFEDRGRYLYCLGPVSVTCACVGLAAAANRLAKRPRHGTSARGGNL